MLTMPSIFYVMPLPSPRCCMYCAPHHASSFQPCMILTPSLDLCCMGTILNVKLSDSTWTQASLPVRAGGLGVRSTTQLAPPAYLASAAGCAHLVQQILPQRLLNSSFPAATEALVVWQQGLKEPAPCAPDSSHQRAWDGPLVTAAAKALVRNAPDELSSCSSAGISEEGVR